MLWLRYLRQNKIIEVCEDDYDKLKEVLKKELPDNMRFQNFETDKYYPKNNNIAGKVRDLNSCYIQYTNNGGTQRRNGLQIDLNIYKEERKIYFQITKRRLFNKRRCISFETC